MKNRRVALGDLTFLILCQVPAEIGYIITMEVGHDETEGEHRCVDLVPNPVDRVNPIEYCSAFAIRPAVGHIRGEHQLQKAEADEPLDRHDVSEKL